MINKSASGKDKVQEKVLAFFKSRQQEKNLSLPLLSKDEQQQAQLLFDQVEPLPPSQYQTSQQDKHQNGSSLSQKQRPASNLQLKIKSILKSGDIEKVISQEKKKVTFIDEYGKNAVLIEGDRRWNEKLKDPRKGKFDPAERRLLIQSLSQCLRQMNLNYDEIVKSFSEEDEKIPRNLHFWTKVCSILPNRSLTSSYKFLKRQLCEKNKGGQWKEDEVLLLEQMVKKYGTKWSMIAKQMHRTADNIRDKYRSLKEQQNNPQLYQTIWKFEQLTNYLLYLQKYSKVEFLSQQIEEELKEAEKHDQIEMKQMKQKKYNSKSFNFHNNETVRKYIGRNFNSIKVQEVNWQKISDKLKNKTLFDCRNKFVQLLQLEIRGMGTKQHYQSEIVKFLHQQKPKHESEINWGAWKSEEITKQEAKNRWMILKRHVCGRGQKQLKQVINELREKVVLKQH